jgi:hypothetical protein
MARPTKYTKEVVASAAHYLENYEEEGDAIPSLAGLSCYLKIARSTLYKWAEEEGKEAFSGILDEIQSTQEKVLINKGLMNEFNSAIVKLALGKHGYSEKTQQEVSGPGGGAVKTDNTYTVEFVNAASKG